MPGGLKIRLQHKIEEFVLVAGATTDQYVGRSTNSVTIWLYSSGRTIEWESLWNSSRWSVINRLISGPPKEVGEGLFIL